LRPDLRLLALAHRIAKLFRHTRLRSRDIARRLLHVLLQLVEVVHHLLFFIGHLLSRLLTPRALPEVAPQPLFEILLLGRHLLGLVSESADLRTVLLLRRRLERLRRALHPFRRALRLRLLLVPPLLPRLPSRRRIAHLTRRLFQ